MPLPGDELPGDDAKPSVKSDPYGPVLAQLQERGRLTANDYQRARRIAEERGEAVLPMLARLGLVSERDVAAAFSEVLHLPLVEQEQFPSHPIAEDRISLRFLKDARILPLREDDDLLEAAFADPVDPFLRDAMATAIDKKVSPVVGLASEIELGLEHLYQVPSDAPETEPDSQVGSIDEDDIEHLKDLASEAPIIRMVNQLIQRALESRASDIHIEPFADQLQVRYRIDGILKDIDAPPVRSTAAVISRVKIMSKLNIAERRLPQDGRIPLRIQGKELDLRVSTVPTLFGESVVMRLLDKESVRFDFNALGFAGRARARLLEVLDRPYGVMLVTGPTGSGKSTTLYTALSRLNTQERKIITVEDPVEYQLQGINQIQVQTAIGMTFASALRAIVRQDPDVIMVGEMRDLETARIAVQSALTGHVVLSTLHTNDAGSAITRLLEMGVEDYLLTSTINGIVGQRLVRQLCPHCREPTDPPPGVAARLEELADGRTVRTCRSVGCPRCNNTGYHGRLVIAEILVMSERIRKAIIDHSTASELRTIALAEGMVSMYDDGLTKALEGLTTVEEVMRVSEAT